MTLLPRISKEQYEALDANTMRECTRAHRARYETTRERLTKAMDMLEKWREHVRLLIQFLMDRDQEYSQQEQARKSDSSKDARSKRRDVSGRLKSEAFLKDTKVEKSIVDAPPGSSPG